MPESLTAGDLGAASVTSSEVADQSLGAADLGPDSVGTSEVAVNAISSDELIGATLRSNQEPIQAGKSGSVSVSCQAGEQVLTGGGTPGKFGVEMTSTFPSGNGWTYAALNDTANDTTITAYALCLGA